jgi:hypothetical protein
MSRQNTPPLKPVPRALEQALAFGEDSMGKALAETLERALDAADVAEIGADTEDHEGPSTLIRAAGQRRPACLT